jgi:MoaA/NifB/PqqE/SkfB family radical SAM enzyme
MKRNVEELEKLGSLSRMIGAELISISNVIPYSSDILDQMLCFSTVDHSPYGNGLSVNLPFIDWTEKNLQPLIHLLKEMDDIHIMHNRIDREQNSCRFIKDRCTMIKWDGNVSPCMGLLHSYKTYLVSGGVEREVTSHTLGNIRERNLKEIWYSDEYRKFRERVDKFDFAPCLRCGSCQYVEKNMEDCFGGDFPTCGGCLWAQGVVQCP